MDESRISRADAQEFTEALGQVAAGTWRHLALAQRMGVPAALGLSTEEWVHEHLGGYVRMNIPERRAAVQELTAEGLSSREVGEVLGVGKTTVARDLAGPDGPQEGPQDPDAGPDGPPARTAPRRAAAPKGLPNLGVRRPEHSAPPMDPEMLAQFDRGYLQDAPWIVRNIVWRARRELADLDDAPLIVAAVAGMSVRTRGELSRETLEASRLLQRLRDALRGP